MLEGGRTPILKPAELDALGFRIVIYGISLLMRVTRTMQETLKDILDGELKLSGTGISLEEYQHIVGCTSGRASRTSTAKKERSHDLRHYLA